MKLTLFVFFESVAWDWISIIAVVIAYVFVIYLVMKTLLQNRNPVSTLSWIMVLVMVPFLGLILYFLFGQKITKRWVFRRMRNKEIIQMREISETQLKALQNMDLVEDRYLNEYHKLMSMLLKNNSSFLSSNNHIHLYHNGKEVYRSLYQDLKAAKNFIHMQYYILEDGEVAEKVTEILGEKSKQGLEVVLIIDGLGSRNLNEKYLQKMKEDGVEVLLFRPVRFPNLANKINNRNHRKIVVIDGEIGYTGGINLADKYLIDYGMEGFWRDTHLRIHGDSVKMLEAVFLVDRYYLTKHIYDDLEPFFPAVVAPPGKHIQIASSSPESGTANILHAFFTAINTAKKNIRLVSPYFIPDESLLMALKTAASGGVKVEIILPGIVDSYFVQYSARSYVQQLLYHDIHVYFYDKGFIHAKILVIDDLLSIIGTANFDYRSFYQNFEISALIYDQATAQELIEQFEKDKLDSVKLNLRAWRRRPMKNKVFESIARLYAPLI